MVDLLLEPAPGHAAGAVGTAGEVGDLVQLLYGATVVYAFDGFHLYPTLSLVPISASASSKTSTSHILAFRSSPISGISLLP